jgi:hypothetical protein
MPLQNGFWSEEQQDVTKLCMHVGQRLGAFSGEDGKEQFLRTGDARCATAVALQDPQLLSEQQEFEILLLFRPTYNHDEIEQQHTELSNETANHSTSGTSR